MSLKMSSSQKNGQSLANKRQQNVYSNGNGLLQTIFDGKHPHHHLQHHSGQLQAGSSRQHSGQINSDRFVDTGKLSLYRDFGSIGQFAKVSEHGLGVNGAFRQHRISDFNDENDEDPQQSIRDQRKPRQQHYQDVQKQTAQKNHGHEDLLQKLFPDQQNQENNEEHNEQEDDCFEMVIQLDSQNSINLKIKPYDDPLLLAKQFCYCNNIDPKVIQILSKQIKQLQIRHFESQSYSNKNDKKSQSISRHESSIKQSGIKSNNKGSHNQSLTHVTQPIDKQNRESLSNANYYSKKQEKTGKQAYFKGSHLEDVDGKMNGNSNNSKRYVQTKNNSYNNTTYLTNNSSQNVANAYNSNTEPENVFDRLYKQSISKIKKQHEHSQAQKNSQSQSKLRYYPSQKDPQLNQSTTYLQNLSSSNIHHTSTTQINASSPSEAYKNQVKIYEKNTKLQKEVRNRNYSIKQQLQLLKEEQCTRQPQINPLSRIIVEKIRETGEMSGEELRNSHVRLYRQSEKSKEKSLSKMIHYQKKKEEMEMQQCSFHPKILKKSQLQTLNTSRFLLLHEDHYIRQNKVKTMKASQTKKRLQRHHPQINEISRKITKQRSFEQRMLEYKTKSEQKQQKLQTQLQHPHTPSINKTSTNSKQPTISIGEYLYNKSQQKKYIKNQPLSTQQQKANININKSSINMYKEMKKNAFRYIFTLMDSDQDGLISSCKINILGLHVDVLQMLAPLLCQMEDVQVQLDQEEFVEAIERLFNTFSVHEKNTILNVYKNPLRKTKVKEQPSFHPSLNEKSIEIAREVRQPGTTLYEIGRQREIQKQAKLSEIRALKAIMEFQQCTFHPNILYHH